MLGAVCLPRAWLFVVVQLLRFRSWWLVRWLLLVLALVLPLVSLVGVTISMDSSQPSRSSQPRPCLRDERAGASSRVERRALFCERRRDAGRRGEM